MIEEGPSTFDPYRRMNLGIVCLAWEQGSDWVISNSVFVDLVPESEIVTNTALGRVYIRDRAHWQVEE